MIKKGYIAAIALTFGVTSLGSFLVQETVAYESGYRDGNAGQLVLSEHDRPRTAVVRLQTREAPVLAEGFTVPSACVSHVDVFGLSEAIVEVEDEKGDTLFLSSSRKNETVFHSTEGMPTVSLKELKPSVRFNVSARVDDIARGKSSQPEL